MYVGMYVYNLCVCVCVSIYLWIHSYPSYISLLQKTVLAVLDRLVKPHWPYLPKKFQDFQLGETTIRTKQVSNSVPDDPMNYYFWYHMLDADEQGRQPKINDLTMDKMFNPKSVSCLRHIAESGDKVTKVQIIW